jgi:hypothetical protein
MFRTKMEWVEPAGMDLEGEIPAKSLSEIDRSKQLLIGPASVIVSRLEPAATAWSNRVNVIVVLVVRSLPVRNKFEFSVP